MVDRIVKFLNIKPDQLQCSKTYFKTDRFGQGYQLDYVEHKCDVAKELPKFIKTFNHFIGEGGLKCEDNTVVKNSSSDASNQIASFLVGWQVPRFKHFIIRF